MTEPARVKIEMAFKSNVGNFQNITVAVSLEDSVSSKDVDRNPVHGGADACAERIYTWVEEQLMTRLDQVKEEIKDNL